MFGDFRVKSLLRGWISLKDVTTHLSTSHLFNDAWKPVLWLGHWLSPFSWAPEDLLLLLCPRSSMFSWIQCQFARCGWCSQVGQCESCLLPCLASQLFQCF